MSHYRTHEQFQFGDNVDKHWVSARYKLTTTGVGGSAGWCGGACLGGYQKLRETLVTNICRRMTVLGPLRTPDAVYLAVNEHIAVRTVKEQTDDTKYVRDTWIKTEPGNSNGGWTRWASGVAGWVCGRCTMHDGVGTLDSVWR